LHLTCCGINHHKGTLEDRERFQLLCTEIAQAVAEFKQASSALEAAIVVTCARIEFYRVDKEKIDPRESVIEFYRNRGVEEIDLLSSLLFVNQETTASRQLFKVTAGLDSLLIGETQVLGQVKEAYSAACSVNGAGKILHKLFHHAFHIAKRVHSETEISSGTTGIAGAAVELIHQQGYDRLKGMKAVVIGANRSAEMILARLTREGVEATLINRTLYKAEKVARPYGADSRPLTELSECLKDADFLFSATSAPDYLVTGDMLIGRKDSKPLLAVDLAIPRDIDPAIASVPAVSLFDLEDIKRHLHDLLQDHLTDLPYATELIEEQVVTFDQWRRQSIGNNHAELRQLLDEDRREILARFQDNFRGGDAKALKAFSRNLYRQFLRRISSLDS